MSLRRSNQFRNTREDTSKPQPIVQQIGASKLAPITFFNKTIPVVGNNNEGESLKLHLAFNSKSLTPSDRSLASEKVLNSTTSTKAPSRSSNSIRRLSSLFKSNSTKQTNHRDSSTNSISRSSSIASIKKISNPIISSSEPPRIHPHHQRGSLIQLKHVSSSLNGNRMHDNASRDSIGSISYTGEGDSFTSTVSEKARKILGIGDPNEMMIGEAITTNDDFSSSSPYSRSPTTSNRNLELQGEDIVRNGNLTRLNSLYTISRVSMDSIREVVDEEDEEEADERREIGRSSTPASSARTNRSDETIEAESTLYEETLKFYTPKSHFTIHSPSISPPPQIPLPPLPLFPNPTGTNFTRPITPITSMNYDSTTSPNPFSSFLPLPPSPPRIITTTNSSTRPFSPPPPNSPVFSIESTMKPPSSSGLVRNISRNFLSRKVSKSDLVAQQLSLSDSLSSDSDEMTPLTETSDNQCVKKKIPLASLYIQSSLNHDPSNWVRSDLSSSRNGSTKWRPEVIRCIASDNNELEVLSQETVKTLQIKAVKLSFVNDIEILVQDSRPPASLSTFSFSLESTKNAGAATFCCVSLINWTNADSLDDNTITTSGTNPEEEHHKSKTTYWIPHALILISRFPLYNLLSDFVRLMWAKSQSFNRVSILMRTVLNQASTNPGSKVALSVKAEIGTTSKTFFVATMPSSTGSSLEYLNINYSPWIIFNALDAENILTILEVALGSKGKVIFASDYSIMRGLSVSVFQQILHRRQWKGLAHSVVHTRDLKLLLEDTGSWIITVPFTSLSPLLKTLTRDILIVDLDRNAAEIETLNPSRFTHLDREIYVSRLEVAIGRSFFNRPHCVPEDLREAFPRGRFRPFSKVEISGKQKEAEQLLPFWKFDLTRILSEIDSIFNVTLRPTRPTSLISKIFGTRSITGPIASADDKDLGAHNILRNQVRQLIDRRDVLETDFLSRNLKSNTDRIYSGTFSSISSSRLASDDSRRSHLVPELDILQKQKELISQRMSDVLTESSESIYQAVYSALESTSKSNHPLVGSESLIHRRTRSRSFHPYSAAAATEDLLEMLLIQEQEEERRAKIVRAVVGETLKSVQSKFNQVLDDDHTRSKSPDQQDPLINVNYYQSTSNGIQMSPLSSHSQSTSLPTHETHDSLTYQSNAQSLSSLKSLELTQKTEEQHLGFTPKPLQLSMPLSPSRSWNTIKGIKSHSRNNSTSSLDGMKYLQHRPSLPILSQRNLDMSNESFEAGRSGSLNASREILWDASNYDSFGKSSQAVKLFTRTGSLKR